MEFLKNFSLQALFLIIVLGIIVNALSNLIREIIKSDMKISQIVALPEVTILKSCVKLTLVVVVIFSLIQLLSKWYWTLLMPVSKVFFVKNIIKDIYLFYVFHPKNFFQEKYLFCLYYQIDNIIFCLKLSNVS